MKNVREVVLDCDNVIWFHKKEEAELMAIELGIKEIEELSYELCNFFDTFMKYFKDKKVTMDETLSIVEETMPILYFYKYTPKQFMDLHEKLKFSVNDFNKDTLELVKYLSSKGIKIIIKTDWWRNIQEELLRTYGILEYIEELHCCDNQYLKANPLSANGIINPNKKDQYVIIGDSLTSDVAFANHAGIKSIWFNRNSEKENKMQYKPTFEVASLLEIIEII